MKNAGVQFKQCVSSLSCGRARGCDKGSQNHLRLSRFDLQTQSFLECLFLNICSLVGAIFLTQFMESTTCLSTPIVSSKTARSHSLKAANRVLHTVRQSHDQSLIQSTSFRYIDDKLLEGIWRPHNLIILAESHDVQENSLFSSVSIDSAEPFLVLEVVEHHLKFAHYNDLTIESHFTTIEAMAAAKQTYLQLNRRRNITSHHEYNEEG